MQPMDGSDIRRLRRRLGATQRGFAAILGVTRETVGLWEIDKCKPSPRSLAKLKEIEEAAEERGP